MVVSRSSMIKTNTYGGGLALEFRARIEVATCVILTKVIIV